MEGTADHASDDTRQSLHRTATEASSPAAHDYESLLWLLSDSNLPTGGFVASAGLESFFAHGFLHDVGVPTVPGSVHSQLPNAGTPTTSRGDQVASSTASFLYLSLSSYARTAIPFIMDVHAVTSACLSAQSTDATSVEDCLARVMRVDDAYHAMTLNHVLRRASKAQGIALLTLYSKSFAEEPDIGAAWGRRPVHNTEKALQRSDKAAKFMSDLKRKIRVAAPRDESPFGHLPICWAAFCAALDIPIESTIKLHLFLQARAILSSSIRLNTLGPYLAHSMLHHQVRRVLAEILQSQDWVRCATSGLREGANSSVPQSRNTLTAFQWDWPEEGAWDDDEKCGGTCTTSPANSWPLGEIVQARHDSLHSRLFNS